jgi:Zn-dependent M28 family amino/carboxypeptidase
LEYPPKGSMKLKIREHVERLSISPRIPESPQHTDAQKMIYDLLDKTGWSPKVAVARVMIKRDPYIVTNIVGAQGPEDAPLVIVGAHYDSVTKSPGADDNASGVAGLLALATKLRRLRPKHARVMLVAYDHEEYGMTGSRLHAIALRHSQPPVRGMASLEMIGYTSDVQDIPPEVRHIVKRTDGKFIVTASNEASRELIEHVPSAKFVEKLVAPAGTGVEQLISLSDNVSFWEQNLPAMIVTDTAFLRNPHYHQKTDTADRLNYDFLESTVEVVEGWVESMVRK